MIFKKIFSVIIFFILSFGIVFGEPGTIKSPLEGAGITSISKLLEVIINGVTIVAIPIIVLAFIYAGFKFVAAQGNSNEVSEAKKIFLYTMAGAAIILGSNVILEVVVNTTGSFMS
jgi:uncharacterized membrane protein